MDGAAQTEIKGSLLYQVEFVQTPIAEFLPTLQKLQTDLAKLYADGRLMEANRLRSQIDDYLQKHENDKAQLNSSQTSVLRKCHRIWKRQAPLRSSLDKDFGLVEGLLKEWETEESWEQGYVCKEYNVHYKQFPKSSFYKFKLEGTMQCDLFQFIAVFNEINLFKTWMPYMMGIGLKSSSEIARPSRLGVVAHVDIALPWPLNPRDLAIDGFGVDLLGDKGTVMLVLRNADGTVCEIPSRSCPRVDLLSGGAMLTPKGDNEIFASFIFSVDPKIETIPAWLMNWGMKNFSGYFFTAMSDVAKRVGVDPACPYHEKMKARPEFYEFLRDRFETWRAAPPAENAPPVQKPAK